MQISRPLSMVVAGVRFKIMPVGLDTPLDVLKAKAKKAIESFKGGVFNDGVEEPIAFGLKALVITFALPESEEVDLVQNKIGEIEGVSSVELIDYRRAVG